jgi:hypothetical protein
MGGGNCGWQRSFNREGETKNVPPPSNKYGGMIPLFETADKPVLDMTRMPDGSYEWNAPSWRVRSLDNIKRRALRGIVTILVTIIARRF